MTERCETCKWWGRESSELRRGFAEDEWYLPESRGQRYCALTFTYRGDSAFPTKAQAHGLTHGILYTAPDFGCVQWEPKDDSQ